MNDQDYRLTEAHICDGTCSTGRLGGHVHPVVRALPRPTAHPAAEAWQGEPFVRVQQRLLSATTGARRRSVVVLPSRSVDRWHEPPAETRSYEERLLSFLLDLRDPALEMTYVSSLPVARQTIDYYMSFLPPSVRRSARKRLRLVSLGDDGHRPLSEKLLERPQVLEQIRRTLADPKLAYLMPYNSTGLERDVALALDIPVFGPNPDHAWLGTKSGSRALFATAGVPHPLGGEHIRTVPDAVEAICALRAAKPELAEAVIKLDHAVSGEGNAMVDLAGLPLPGTRGEGGLIQQRLECLVSDVEGVSSAAYLRKLAAQGGVVEERIIGRDLRSPSVQLEITPAGAVRLLSTHDQILHGRSGQQFAGCRFPADRAYAPVISALAQQVAAHLADTGVIGRLGVDFLVIRGADDRWQAFALEVNLRMGGTTHPYQTARPSHRRQLRPTDRELHDPAGVPTALRRRPITWSSPSCRCSARWACSRERCSEDLRFDHDRGRGVVFHMLSSIDALATVGVTAIADTPHAADDLYARVRTVLARAGAKRAKRDRPMPVHAALGTQG